MLSAIALDVGVGAAPVALDGAKRIALPNSATTSFESFCPRARTRVPRRSSAACTLCRHRHNLHHAAFRIMPTRA
jgi:hypothetical protein